MTLAELGKRVRSLREAKNLTQEKLSEKSDVHQRYIGAIERGQRNATFKTLSSIARGLGVELYELFLAVPQEKTDAEIRRASEKLLKECDGKEARQVFDFLRVLKT